jgi:hypothetical protein
VPVSAVRLPELLYWRGERLVRPHAGHEPGLLFFRHFLAVTEQYVVLREAERVGAIFEAYTQAFERGSREADDGLLVPRRPASPVLMRVSRTWS